LRSALSLGGRGVGSGCIGHAQHPARRMGERASRISGDHATEGPQPARIEPRAGRRFLRARGKLRRGGLRASTDAIAAWLALPVEVDDWPTRSQLSSCARRSGSRYSTVTWSAVRGASWTTGRLPA
jgi:hypothetical protein